MSLCSWVIVLSDFTICDKPVSSLYQASLTSEFQARGTLTKLEQGWLGWGKPIAGIRYAAGSYHRYQGFLAGVRQRVASVTLLPKTSMNQHII